MKFIRKHGMYFYGTKGVATMKLRHLAAIGAVTFLLLAGCEEKAEKIRTGAPPCPGRRFQLPR